MSEVTVGIIALFVLLLLFTTGIELGFAMAAVGVAGFAYLNSSYAAWNLLGRDIFDALSSYGFTVIPLFVLMGQIGSSAGIAVRLYDSAHKFVGHIPGGLAMATVLGATGFKAICGSSPATAATFASVAIPEMDRYGYDARLSTGIVSSVATLGAIIPPSIALILFGIITEQSIGKLFLGGIIPGLMAALFFIGIIYGWARINPALAPRSKPYSWKARWASLPEVIWVLIVFLLVVGGIMEGLFTPSEAGAVGTFALLLPSDRRRLDRESASQSVHDHDPDLPHLRTRRLLHRRPGLHDPCDADLLPGGAEARFRPPVVRHTDRRDDHDRCGHTAGGDLRFCRQEYHQSADRDHLQGCPAILDFPDPGRGTVVCFSTARALAPFRGLLTGGTEAREENLILDWHERGRK
jgi:hypothetical protein